MLARNSPINNWRGEMQSTICLFDQIHNSIYINLTNQWKRNTRNKRYDLSFHWLGVVIWGCLVNSNLSFVRTFRMLNFKEFKNSAKNSNELVTIRTTPSSCCCFGYSLFTYSSSTHSLIRLFVWFDVDAWKFMKIQKNIRFWPYISDFLHVVKIKWFQQTRNQTNCTQQHAWFAYFTQFFSNTEYCMRILCWVCHSW